MAGGVNRPIVIAAVGITGLGIVNAWTQGQGITRIVIGGYMLMLFLSVADIFGGGVSTIAGAIAMLALLWAFLNDGLPVLARAGVLVQPPDAAPAPTPGGGKKQN